MKKSIVKFYLFVIFFLCDVYIFKFSFVLILHPKKKKKKLFYFRFCIIYVSYLTLLHKNTGVTTGYAIVFSWL